MTFIYFSTLIAVVGNFDCMSLSVTSSWCIQLSTVQLLHFQAILMAAQLSIFLRSCQGLDDWILNTEITSYKNVSMPLSQEQELNMYQPIRICLLLYSGLAKKAIQLPPRVNLSCLMEEDSIVRVIAADNSFRGEQSIHHLMLDTIR